MDLMLWFSGSKDIPMYRPWNFLNERGYLDNYETIHRNKLYNRPEPWQYIYKVIKNRNAIWIFSGPPYEPSIIPISVAAKLKHKTILFSSTPFWESPKFRGRTGLAKRAWKSYLQGSEVVMVTTAAQEALSNTLGIESRVIPHACDAARYQPKDDIEKRDNVVLFVGKLIETKGVTKLLQIAIENPGTEFWICGDGKLRDKVKSAAATHDNITYFGFISDEERLARIYNQASILAVPSISHELFGIVIIEALACGTPVIASDRSGPRSILNESVGITIGPCDVGTLDTDVFENAIFELLDDRERRRSMGQAGRELVETTYDVEVVGSQWLELFEKLEND
jgi:glycosyltransferase involved in cell wall biosynthesis